MTAAAIASLLRRATSSEKAEQWPQGAFVERELDGIDRLRGRVAFVEEGWVHWVAEDGSCHASKPSALRRTF